VVEFQKLLFLNKFIVEFLKVLGLTRILILD
jgi:hypothetical protein